ncbi:hypothetical protein FA95DRAFT_1541713 [Auriscalpium vulgare]|uniref:Uncharacterized protein n=1 Tax=Auriscalpium vulgare TaxID=40419 RepID=A0ACB8RT05_9AGAM|nr:hypothetical protein FA95DRAFT_1541713 [Auriscalpium vulgare]
MPAGPSKRKLDAAEDGNKPKKLKEARGAVPTASAPGSGPTNVDHEAPSHPAEHNPPTSSKGKERETQNPQASSVSSRPRHRVKKLVAPRPFPTVPTSVSATGPRSAHHEGKNYIAVTRKTPLGSYLRRCKDVILKDGYKTLHLNALGAAIPHLTLLAVSLPPILPFGQDEIRTEIRTGTVEVMDELIPEDEDEDISYRTRGKSSMSVVITIGDGVDEKTAGGSKWAPRGKRRPRGRVVQEDLTVIEATASGDRGDRSSEMDMS